MKTTAPVEQSITSPPAVAGSTLSTLVAMIPASVMLTVALVELVLANRKYGLFTGGFGQSRAVDSLPEMALFFAGYAAAMALLGVAGWAFACRLARGKPGWIASYLFILTNGILFCGLLAAQYQLHSYFSDAVSFALVKQLGGGSLVDAIKYGLSEIGIAGLAALGVTLAAWLLWRQLARFMPANSPSARGPGYGVAAASVILFLGTAYAIPRSGSDAAFGLNRTIAWQGMTRLLNFASDLDGDGYGVFSTQYDAAPFDPARHPLALDVPGNGVDEDGYGGDLELVPVPAPLPKQNFTGHRPNVVVVVLESLRQDVIGKRIGGRPVAPNLERLAAQGSIAAPAYSHVGFTTESLKSLFSGQLVPSSRAPSLFRDFKASGYRIGVFSGQPEDFGDISATVGMRESADVHVDALTLQEKRAFSFAAKGSLLVAERYLLDAFDRTMGKQPWTEPHFLYFNFQSAHFPYYHDGVKLRFTQRPLDRGDMTQERAKDVQLTYWNAVAEADAWLGQVISRLKALGVWDDTVLLVTGDHGEDLFEDGFLGHGHIINARQNGTVVVTNRPGLLPKAPVSLSDYRAFLVAAIKREAPARPAAAPFMHIGPLERPTAIGMAGAGRTLTSLRLDTGEVCFVEQGRCAPYGSLNLTDRSRVDAVVARWGSERWRQHTIRLHR